MTTDTKPKWEPIVVECAKCHTKISSSYPGEFVKCECGAIAIDQTRHYVRFIGNLEDFVDDRSVQS